MRLQPKIGTAAIVVALTACGCQTSTPKPDPSAEEVSQADESVQVEPSTIEQASAVEPTSDEPATGEQTTDEQAPDEVEQDEAEQDSQPPEQASLVIEVTTDVLTVDGDEILSLSDGYIRSSGFQSQRFFNIKGLVEPVEQALLVERRRRVVYGEEPSAGRVLVKVDPKVPADTILGLQYTLAVVDAEWLTLQVGDQAPMHMPLDADFIGRRLVRWSERKPPELEPEPETSEETSGHRKYPPSQGDLGRLHNRFGTSVIVGTRKSGYSSNSSGSNGIHALGSVSSSSGSASGFGGLGLRGAGRGGGGVGIGRIGTASNESAGPDEQTWRAARHCDASSESPAEPKAFTHATVKLFPKSVSAWLSERNRGYNKAMYWSDEVDADYPWWKVYNSLAQMRHYYGEADTLVIWPHPSLGSEILSSVTRVNCELPKRSYASSQEWQAARAELSECEPMFDTQVLANGKWPRND